jgi:hypothetical protein
MKTIGSFLMLLITAPLFAGPQITIYNDGFATVKEDRTLNLTKGVSEVRVADMSRMLEPDSVMIRELAEGSFGSSHPRTKFCQRPAHRRIAAPSVRRQNVALRGETGKTARSRRPWARSFAAGMCPARA